MYPALYDTWFEESPRWDEMNLDVLSFNGSPFALAEIFGAAKPFLPKVWKASATVYLSRITYLELGLGMESFHTKAAPDNLNVSGRMLEVPFVRRSQWVRGRKECRGN